MDFDITGNRRAAEDIIALTRQWDRALENGDVAALTRDYDPGVEVFDVGTQVVGPESYRALWQACLPRFGDAPQISRRKVRLHADEHLAVLHGYTKICGSRTTDPDRQPWCRTTVCFHKIDGRWSVVHEHVSMPVDCEQGRPAYLVGEP